MQTSRRIALSWLLLAAVSVALSVVTRQVWSALVGAGFVVPALAWLLRRPAWLGKRADGGLALWSWVVSGPFLALTWLTWRLTVWMSTEDARNEIVDGVWLGRRPTRAELSASGAAAVLDLTSELPATTRSADVAYRTVPSLDAVGPTSAGLQEAVAWLREAPRPVWVHCAAGHGRSAAVLVAWLAAEGDADPEATVRRARPAVGWRRTQLQVLEAAIGRD
ncbi:MAG: dual specificity protein phosphatase family protein [Myxococcales bacterium]|nr:dual specificity protein phosphatase family protein [Myxococcales bacterium]